MTIVGFWSLYHDVVTIVCKNPFMALVVMTTNKNSLKRHYFEHSRCYYSRYNYWKLHHLRLRLRCATTSTPSRSKWRQLEDPQRDLSLSRSTKRRLYVSSSRFANRKCSSTISVVLKHLDLKFQKSTKLEWRWQVEKEASPAIATQLTWIAPLKPSSTTTSE